RQVDRRASDRTVAARGHIRYDRLSQEAIRSEFLVRRCWGHCRRQLQIGAGTEALGRVVTDGEDRRLDNQDWIPRRSEWRAPVPWRSYLDGCPTRRSLCGE